MKASQGTEDILMIHAALVALTPLIPLPFVDDLARSRLQRRMVRELAGRRQLVLAAGAVELIADDDAGGPIRGIGRRLALMPFRFVLRRLLLVLRGKAIIDLVSRTYHRGFLVDAAFAHGLCEPAGTATPREVRQAVEVVLARIPVAESPITHAISTGLERSRRSLIDAYGRLRGQAPTNVDTAFDAAAQTLTDEGLIDQMRRALGEVPTAHFENLERALLEALAERRGN